MKHIYNTDDWLFNSYSQMLDDLGGDHVQFTPRVYERWLGEWSTRTRNEIFSALAKFIESGDFRMHYRHFGREFKVEARSCPNQNMTLGHPEVRGGGESPNLASYSHG